MNEPTTLNRKNYNALDIMKFICSILVISIHIHPFGTTEEATLRLLNDISQYIARLAVPFFFICSGFFLFINKNRTHNDDYIKTYIIRIIRLYITWSVIYLPIIVYNNIKNNNTFIDSLLIYLRNFIFTGSYLHLWYLKALLVAVFIIKTLLKHNLKPTTILIISFILYIIGLFDSSWYGILLPVRARLPAFWNFLRLAKKVIITTRNGIFFGFVYVSIGMCFAYYKRKITKRKAATGFLISMVLLLIEMILLRIGNMPIRSNDMYLFLFPSAIFMFTLIEQLEMKSVIKYKMFRKVSSLIFYIHLWIALIFDKIMEIISLNISYTCLPFIVITTITIIVSYLIYKASLNNNFGFLRKLYE